MKKALALLGVVCGTMSSFNVVAQESKSIEYTIDGKKYSCAPRVSEPYFNCERNGEKFILDEGYRYNLISKGNPPKIVPVSEIYREGHLAYKLPALDFSEADTIENRMLKAYSINNILSNAKEGSFAAELYNENLKFINEHKGTKNKVKVVTPDNETLTCERGQTRDLTAEEIAVQKSSDVTFECMLYSCTGNNPSEKILASLNAAGNNYIAPYILRMKDGQAAIVDDKFKVMDDGPLPVSEVNKGIYRISATPSLYHELDADLSLPSKYNDSKTSYDYLMRYASSNYADTFGQEEICTGPLIKNILDEKKKIASDMQSYLAQADIVAYLKAVNGDIRAYYVDKTKAMQLGCDYKGKILDASVLPELQRLDSLSGSRKGTKYPELKEVQKLFEKAKNMKDLPFGYKYDGCYARAHIMARRFEKMGMRVKKAWIKGDLSVPGTDIRWNYHVAPMILAKDANGKIEQYVIDPSLADKVLTLDEWVATMDKNSAKGPIMKTTYPFPQNGLEFQRTVVAVSSSDPYAPMDQKGISERDKMRDAENVLAEYTEILKSNESN